eukprot:4053103-Prymnesium_polylepis.1
MARGWRTIQCALVWLPAARRCVAWTHVTRAAVGERRRVLASRQLAIVGPAARLMDGRQHRVDCARRTRHIRFAARPRDKRERYAGHSVTAYSLTLRPTRKDRRRRVVVRLADEFGARECGERCLVPGESLVDAADVWAFVIGRGAVHGAHEEKVAVHCGLTQQQLATRARIGHSRRERADHEALSKLLCARPAVAAHKPAVGASEPAAPRRRRRIGYDPEREQHLLLRTLSDACAAPHVVLRRQQLLGLQRCLLRHAGLP